MKPEKPSMILTAALMHGLGLHLGAWMARDGSASDYLSGDFYKELALTAEAGKLHAIFLAEQITNQENGVERPCGTLDTVNVYCEYSACLDEGRFEDWPDFFLDECEYRIQPRENYERKLPLSTLWLESKGMMKDRVYGIRETIFHDPYYQRHIVSAPRVLSASEGEIRSEANYLVIRVKRDEPPEVFNAGRYVRHGSQNAGWSEVQSAALHLRQRVDSKLDCLSDLARCSFVRISAPELVLMSDDWVEVAALADVPDGEVIAVTVADQEIALYGVAGEIYATENICTHGHARLCDGFLEDAEIECPLHQGRFDVRSGKAVLAPAAEDLRTFPVKIADGKVQVRLKS